MQKPSSPEAPPPDAPAPIPAQAPPPDGKMRLDVAHKNGRVILSFSTLIRWVPLSSAQALELARQLKKHALLAR